MRYQAVLKFWFKECTPEQWFKKSKQFDAKVRKRFLKTYREVLKGGHAEWRRSAKGRLAEILVIDQFARNMFRGTPQAFAGDVLALALAQEAIASGATKKLSKQERWFTYMPFMHSESKKIQRESVALFSTLGNKRNLFFAKDHRRIIDRFGRFPHRNAILGRTSTTAERKFMRTHKGF